MTAVLSQRISCMQKSSQDVKTPKHKHIPRDELKRLGMLGVGGFGTVTLEEHTLTGSAYALKEMSKGFLVKMGMQGSVVNEKMILSMTDSVFIVKLFQTYREDQTLSFLLEPCLGGELYETY